MRSLRRSLILALIPAMVQVELTWAWPGLIERELLRPRRRAEPEKQLGIVLEWVPGQEGRYAIPHGDDPATAVRYERDPATGKWGVMGGGRQRGVLTPTGQKIYDWWKALPLAQRAQVWTLQQIADRVGASKGSVKDNLKAVQVHFHQEAIEEISLVRGRPQRQQLPETKSAVPGFAFRLPPRIERLKQAIRVADSRERLRLLADQAWTIVRESEMSWREFIHELGDLAADSDELAHRCAQFAIDAGALPLFLDELRDRIQELERRSKVRRSKVSIEVKARYQEILDRYGSLVRPGEEPSLPVRQMTTEAAMGEVGSPRERIELFRRMFAEVERQRPSRRQSVRQFYIEFGALTPGSSQGGVDLTVSKTGRLELGEQVGINLKGYEGQVVRVIPYLEMEQGEYQILFRIFALEGRDIPEPIWQGRYSFTERAVVPLESIQTTQEGTHLPPEEVKPPEQVPGPYRTPRRVRLALSRREQAGLANNPGALAKSRVEGGNWTLYKAAITLGVKLPKRRSARTPLSKTLRQLVDGVDVMNSAL